MVVEIVSYLILELLKTFLKQLGIRCELCLSHNNWKHISNSRKQHKPKIYLSCLKGSNHAFINSVDEFLVSFHITYFHTVFYIINECRQTSQKKMNIQPMPSWQMTIYLTSTFVATVKFIVGANMSMFRHTSSKATSIMHHAGRTTRKEHALINHRSV